MGRIVGLHDGVSLFVAVMTKGRLNTALLLRVVCRDDFSGGNWSEGQRMVLLMGADRVSMVSGC